MIGVFYVPLRTHRGGTDNEYEQFSRSSCRDSNSRPFDHESGALTNKLSRLPLRDVDDRKTNTGVVQLFFFFFFFFFVMGNADLADATVLAYLQLR